MLKIVYALAAGWILSRGNRHDCLLILFLLEEKMKKLSAQLEFEDAASVRDDIKRLQILELQIRDGKSLSDV